MWWWKKKKKTLPLIVCIQGSLQPHALTDILVEEAAHLLVDVPVSVGIVDVRRREHDYDKTIVEAFERAAGYLVIMPVYSTVVSGAVKDLITTTAAPMKGKPACCICVGKSAATYPAAVNLVDLLTACDVKVIKPILRVHPESFQKNVLFDEQVRAVLKEMLAALVKKIS